MRKLRVLVRVGRFLVPATAVLERSGTLKVLPRSEISEAFKVRGSLSPREVGVLMSAGLEMNLSEGGCEFRVRRASRRLEPQDEAERRLLEQLGVEVGGLVKGGSRFYGEIHLVELSRGSQQHTLLVDASSAQVLRSYLSRYCEERDEASS